MLRLTSKGQGEGETDLRCTTVALLSTFYKSVSTHRATHEPVDIWDIGQAACLGLHHEGLQVNLATPAEFPWEFVAKGKGYDYQGVPHASLFLPSQHVPLDLTQSFGS